MSNPNPKSSSNSNTKPATEPQKPADAKHAADTAPVIAEQATEPVKTEPQVAPVPGNGAKPDTRTIISISVPEKLARQVRLLSKLEGVTISALFLRAVEKEVPVRLRAALLTITDVD